MSYSRLYRKMYDPGYLEIPTPAQVRERMAEVKRNIKKERSLILDELDVLINNVLQTRVSELVKKQQKPKLSDGSRSVNTTPDSSPSGSPNKAYGEWFLSNKM